LFSRTQKNCKGHIDTIGSDKIPKQVSKYQPKEKGDVWGIYLKRRKDYVM
jgi:hypothetical protein